MFEAQAVLITAFYTVLDPYVATLRISGDNDQLLELIVLHVSGHSTDETREYTLHGDGATPKIDVEEKDMLIVLARRRGHVVASQVYEVSVDLTERGYLLIPRGGYNVLCDQEEYTDLHRLNVTVEHMMQRRQQPDEILPEQSLEPAIPSWAQPSEALTMFLAEQDVEEVQ